MKLSILAGSTSQTVNIFIRDSSSTTGGGLTGLVFNSAGLTAYYALPRADAAVITLATLASVTSAYSSGGFVEISAANMPGWYRFDIPDAALASGRFTTIHLKGATNMAPVPIEIELTAWNNQSATNGGLTNLDAAITSRMATFTQPTGFLAATFPTTVASTTNITAGTITTVTNLTNAPTAGDLTATMKASVTTAATAATPIAASVSGSVGSVVGLTAANLDVAVSSRLATAGYTAPDNAGIATIEAVTDKLDTALVLDGAVYQYTANALELAPAGGSGLDAAGVRAAIGLASANLDTQLSTIDTVVDAVKVKTDQLVFTAGNVNANTKAMNDAAVLGNGTDVNLWRGA